MNPFKRRPGVDDLEGENSVEGERDLSSVNEGISLQNKLTNWAVMAGACILAAVLLYKYYANVYDAYQQKEGPAKDETRTVTTATLPPLIMPAPEPAHVSTSMASEALPPLQASVATPEAALMPAAGQPSFKPMAELVRERRLKREVRFSLDGGGDAMAVSQLHATGHDARLAASGTQSVPGDSEADQAGRGASGSATRAYLLGDPMLTITRGSTIACTIIPAIDTSLTGTVTCVTAEDVTGADNTVSLMDRGTLCTGRQGGGVVHGQRRVGIIWQRCQTPQHVLVPLDAATSDALGRPGIAGAVDHHFWDRFGAAIALSVVTDIGPYLAATRQRGSNNTTIAFPTVSAPKEVVSEVLKSSVAIAPTITAAQGAPVLIYLAADVSFQDVYDLKKVK